MNVSHSAHYFMKFDVDFVTRQKYVQHNDPNLVDEIIFKPTLKLPQFGTMFISENKIWFQTEKQVYLFSTHLCRGTCLGREFKEGFGLFVEALDFSLSCYVFMANSTNDCLLISHYVNLLMPIKWQQASIIAKRQLCENPSTDHLTRCLADSSTSSAVLQAAKSGVHLDTGKLDQSSFLLATKRNKGAKSPVAGAPECSKTPQLASTPAPQQQKLCSSTTTKLHELQTKNRRSIASPRPNPKQFLKQVLNHRHSLGPVIPRFSRIGKVNNSTRFMPDSADDTGVNLEQLLKSETARASFQNFLQQQFCAENLTFYLAVEDYKLLNNEEQRRELGRQIYERHFMPNSIEPVNIDNATCKGIMESIQTENFSRDIYNVAQYQIYHLLKYDVWPRFLSSGGKPPTASELSDSKKGARKDNSSTTSSARSTNSTQQLTSADKSRIKRKSFFKFLRRNNKESIDDAESPTCSITGAVPCTSKKPTSGVYGESEPCTGSAGELRSSLSPTATKRRMTRERSVPASSSRSASSTSTTMIVTQSNADDGGRICSTSAVCRTRAMSSRENNNSSIETLTTKTGTPKICVLSPESTTSTSTTPLPSSSRQTSLTGQQPGETSRSSVTSGSTVHVPPDPTTALLHDEKELSSTFSVAVTHGRLEATTPRTSSNKNLNSNYEKPARPAIFASTISNKETPSDFGAGCSQWQKADYV